mmetsp:Transcript_139024/g.432520  ORF Transcript_139024/g.432520 Transcript_139024/m.432520 type:complete len:113 (+) Transcript_139024:89-427(+)|eukprot:CAMPEP_0204521290 /NCGR_PEP_ID=MMETSP0661-20131031/5703_1 /ASSEMBLY_ACC=CAM_ASM_000606 /TAXON_ID=109239 /ORGANISM="Alexandrium margalefi, Strain AMGDE01CS-322" /LENGTH=112 /DNA_ID=CAMNT_0051526875 /DNA_START=84 /DNA_END=422 /DNA_ORIENTATION=+
MGNACCGPPDELRDGLPDFPLKREAIRVFEKADKDHNGKLNMEELSNVRNSKQAAEIMMQHQDANADGLISKQEWLAYIKQISDKNEANAERLLKLYDKQIGETRDMKLAKG